MTNNLVSMKTGVNRRTIAGYLKRFCKSGLGFDKSEVVTMSKTLLGV